MTPNGDKHVLLRQRRRKLMRAIGKSAAAVVSAAGSYLRNNDVEYPFRQNSDFFYLTAFPEPNAIAVLTTEGSASQLRYTLFCQPKDPREELWTGARIGCQDAVRVYGADQAYPIDEFAMIFPHLIHGRTRVYGPQPTAQTWQFNSHIIRSLSIHSGSVCLQPVEPLIHELRLRKTAMETDIMFRAAQISCQAHCRAMRACRPEMYEYEVEAEFLHVFRQLGAVPAYPCIVGGGVNACTLHYTKNNTKLRHKDLLLVDAGAEWENYASDVTRTYPVAGRFSAAQRELYEVVLQAQSDAIRQIKPGNRYDDFHHAAVRTLTMGLKELGLLRGPANTLIKEGAYRRFYMHNTGHWLGMDVHDVGDYQVNGKWRMLEPGMVMTVEPGLYIKRDVNIRRRWWNTGIRIEDDVVVTATGNRVLTEMAPKDPDAIEAMMASGGPCN